MQLLIVHRDSEMGEALVQTVKSYTGDGCELVGNDVAALDWARRHQQCNLLLTELEAEGINGLALGSSLSEIFPALQVLFFPNYPAAEQRLEIADTKVFPEPIEGDDLLAAIERAENARPNTPDLFHVADVLQMCCLCRRSFPLQFAKQTTRHPAFLLHGKH